MTDRSPRAETLGHVYTLFGTGGVSGLTDGQLLERFLSGRPGLAEPAFAALVDRHGPTVLKVCSGVLRDRHDAEDAFQATFLVLALRARSIRNQSSVASWLYGVALRVAAGSRSSVARRRKHELRALRVETIEPGEPGSAETATAVHEEIGRLPDRYRAPVVLCFLEGLSHEDAAQQLSWPVGTVKSRLARAKDRLRGRLSRRGLANTVVPLRSGDLSTVAIPVERGLAEAAVRTATAGASSPAVAQLVKGALRAMSIARWKTVAVAGLAAAGIVGAGVGVVAGQGPEERPTVQPVARAAAAAGAPPSAEAGNDRAAIAALEKRIEEIERRLKIQPTPPPMSSAPAAEPGPNPTNPMPGLDPALLPVWGRCEGEVVEILVKTGARVEQGTPLAVISCAKLAQEKNEYLMKQAALRTSEREVVLVKKLRDNGSISMGEALKAETGYETSKIELSQARDRLVLTYGLTDEDLRGLSSDQDSHTKARFTLRSPARGKVHQVTTLPLDSFRPDQPLFQISLDPPHGRG